MAFSIETTNNIKRLNRVADNLKLVFARRDAAIDLMRLALLCREHCLLLGPPGTGKSELVANFADGIHARGFQYLLTRFTEPAELFGPIDLAEFKNGRYHVRTEGMLPEAQVAFLDEVFQANSAILNTLLTLVHERIFYNGAEMQRVPLLALFGASNHLPDDPTLHAFSDRFVLRIEIETVGDEHLSELLDKGWALERDRLSAGTRDVALGALVTPEQLDHLYIQLREINVGQVQSQYQELIRRLRAEGVQLSDRRVVKGLKLIRGAALLEGREHASPADLWPLNFMWSSQDDVAVLRDVVQPLVEEAGGPALERHRPVEDLIDELELLEGQVSSLSGDGAYTAHLGSLGQVRRELMLYHPSEKPLLERAERVIQQVLEAMRAGL